MPTTPNDADRQANCDRTAARIREDLDEVAEALQRDLMSKTPHYRPSDDGVRQLLRIGIVRLARDHGTALRAIADEIERAGLSTE